ncbi:MAG: hypothetical protein JW882_02805 [Deltaproteobacteria bacterium]|nr:hypothetical protein [Deltaproteobacteria bacterium]
MLISKENYEIREKIWDFENRIDNMHLDFYKYYQGVEAKMPDWETLEKDLIFFSRKKITDIGLSKNLDRVLFKFQNRKKIWLTWVEEFHHSSKKENP